MAEATENEPKKQKFTFKCTQCGKCCERGDIPVTIWDLELWAKNGVVANLLYNLTTVNQPTGLMDLVLKAKPLDQTKNSGEETSTSSDSDQKSPETAIKCPYFNQETKNCTIYENRPLACRSFPLEYDGNHFMLSDLDCPGVGEGPMTKEELVEIRNYAKLYFNELRRTRIALPVLAQVIGAEVQRGLFEMLQRQSEEMMAQMSDEDRQKMEEIYQKSMPEPEKPE